MRQIYNKLVRDKIPDIIKSHGEKPITDVLNDQKYIELLNQKLSEEVNEYLESKELEELADILEIIRAIAHTKNMSLEDILEMMEKKKKARGGFEGKIFLSEVITNENK